MKPELFDATAFYNKSEMPKTIFTKIYKIILKIKYGN